MVFFIPVSRSYEQVLLSKSYEQVELVFITMEAISDRGQYVGENIVLVFVYVLE